MRVDLAHHKVFRAKDGKGGIKLVPLSHNNLTSLFEANFSQAVTHNSIASVLISSFISDC